MGEVEVGGIGINCVGNGGGVKRGRGGDDDDFVCYVYICFSIFFSDFLLLVHCSCHSDVVTVMVTVMVMMMAWKKF